MNRYFNILLEPINSNRFIQDWQNCLDKYNKKLDAFKIIMDKYFLWLERIKIKMENLGNQSIAYKNLNYLLGLSSSLKNIEEFIKYTNDLLNY